MGETAPGVIAFEPAMIPAGTSDNQMARLLLLYEVGSRLSAVKDLEELLRQIVDAAARVMEARASSLMLVADDGAHLRFAVAFGEKGDQLTGLQLPIDDQSIAGWVALHGDPLIEDDVHKLPFFSGDVDRRVDYQTQSIVCVPLRTQERIIGVVEVLNKTNGQRFTDDDVSLLTALAGSAAVAIENARLLKETTERAERLAQLLDELRSTYRGTMHALSALLDTRDNSTWGHSQRVILFSLAIARALGITDAERLRNLEYGALLHDVGKIGVSDAVLRKPGQLTPEEWAEMRRHPELGYNMLRGIAFLAPALPIVLHHHERYNGGGYPTGLRGAAIPEEARIFAIADVFDALTSERYYHRARTYAEARAIIEAGRGTDFDPAVVDAFCRISEAEWDRLRSQAGDTER